MHGYRQSKADPCAFRKLVEGKANVALVVHVEGILASSHRQEAMEQGIADASMHLSSTASRGGRANIWTATSCATGRNGC